MFSEVGLRVYELTKALFVKLVHGPEARPQEEEVEIQTFHSLLLLGLTVWFRWRLAQNGGWYISLTKIRTFLRSQIRITSALILNFLWSFIWCNKARLTRIFETRFFLIDDILFQNGDTTKQFLQAHPVRRVLASLEYTFALILMK